MSISWINSGGGPLVCATPSSAAVWRGASGSSVGCTDTDYTRACKVSEYLSVISCGEDAVLILGDEPLQSQFFALDVVFIARWVSCRSQEMAAQALDGLPKNLPEIEAPLKFSVLRPRLVLFDAALDGLSENKTAGVSVKPGGYAVTTEVYKKERQFEFLIHRFIGDDVI